MTAPKLLPCPFCGGIGQIFHDDGGDYGKESWRVDCLTDGCGCWEDSAESALAAWNKRTP